MKDKELRELVYEISDLLVASGVAERRFTGGLKVSQEGFREAERRRHVDLVREFEALKRNHSILLQHLGLEIVATDGFKVVEIEEKVIKQQKDK